MKLFYKLLVVVLSGIISVSLVGCNTDANREAKEEKKAQENAVIENKIYEVLHKTQVDPMFAPTIGNMVMIVFHNFDVKWGKYKSTSQYEVEISGNYCPNPDIPTLSMKGSITYLVDIEKSSCIVLHDYNNLTGTFLVFILN